MLKSAESTRGWRRGVALGVGWAIVAAWLVYLLLQTGDPWDEAEHAHVAWLMSQGKRPLVDFFQHHQPLLWTLLSPYYRLGFQGAGVLLWGRVLVVCCALATVFSLRRLGHWAGVAVWIFLTLLIPKLFVVRPETISTGLIFVGLAIWAGPATSTLRVVLAGAAAGAAVYASPRFLLLGGFFVLLGRQTRMRWVYLCAGGVGFAALYTVLADYPLSQVWFNTAFSAHLQTIDGDVSYEWFELWQQVSLYTCGPLVLLIVALRREHRVRAMLLIGYAAVVYLLCVHFAGMFCYSQALAPFLVGVTIAAAWVCERVELPPSTTGAVGFGAAVLLVVTGILNLPPVLVQMQPLNLLSWIKSRDELAAHLPPGEAALMYARHSPISAPDISYYGSPLWDGADRLCTAVRTFQTSRPLPKCDFELELEKLPYYTDHDIKRAISVRARKESDLILYSAYKVMPMGEGLNETIEVRKASVSVAASHP